jgi:hypothetical protein
MVEPSGQRWFWTPARRGFCHRCARDVVGELIAYSFERQAAYCTACADQLGLASECVESKRAHEARHARLIEDAERYALAGTA